MAKATGFLEYEREETPYRPVAQRVRDWRAVHVDPPIPAVQRQAARCMDCGIPFCHQGCPLGNTIPDWNDLVYRDRWQSALTALHSTNNFPEFTGLVCPAPCEASCVLGLNQKPVAIKQVEWEIIRSAWERGLVTPQRPSRRTGRSVAVVGSGPAGLAAAQQLNRAGHTVTVFEKQDRIGGLLRYGIPDFKLEKAVLDRRLEQLRAEGVSFQAGVHVGADLSVLELRRGFDAAVLCTGAEQPRDLAVPGRERTGVHFAMDYLRQSNQRVAGDAIPPAAEISATGRRVVVLGGGDTGSDCVGTAHRQRAASVTSIELLERPPDHTNPVTPWPSWPLIYRSSSSHDEGGEREFAIATQRFEGRGERVEAIRAVRLAFGDPDPETGRRPLRELPGSELTIPADLVLLAMGFLHPVRTGLLEELDLRLDPRGQIEADTRDFATSEPGIFAAGDCRRGQSLVVWAIWEGREAARAVDRYLQAETHLPARDAYY